MSFIASICFAQEKFELNKDLKLISTPEVMAEESAFYIQDNRRIKYKFGKIDGESAIIKAYTRHYIVKLLNEKGIQSFNKIHLPIFRNASYKDIKAQVINSKGERIVITESKIKKQKDDNGNEEYFIALEGIDKGAQVEFMFTQQTLTNSFEGRSIFASSFPMQEAHFELQVPENLQFEIKGYFGFDKVSTDTTDEIVIHAATLKNLKPIKEESYGNSYLIEPFVAYRLSYIPATSGSVRLYSWNKFAGDIHSIYYEFDEKKDAKAVLKFLKKNGITTDLSESDRIIKIEELIKSNISIEDKLPSNKYLSELIKNKTGNSRTITRLYCACFKLMDVQFELGLTSNRYEYQLDEDFELWNSINYFIIKFKKQEGYITTEDISLRYPLVSNTVYGNKGVFCKTRTLGGMESAIADIEVVQPQESAKNNYDMQIDVSFEGDDFDPLVKTSTAYYGLAATPYRPIFVFTEKSKHKEILKELAQIKEKMENIKDFNIDGIGFDNIPKEKPLILATTLLYPSLVSRAGNNILFKLGQVIGPQAEMYEKEDRRLPIDVNFMHHLLRTITVDLIPGYKIKNLDDIIIDKQFADYGFVSSYKIEGQKLIIKIDEYYKKLQMPKSQIEQFRSVINAAADFNKVTLVLEKE